MSCVVKRCGAGEGRWGGGDEGCCHSLSAPALSPDQRAPESKVRRLVLPPGPDPDPQSEEEGGIRTVQKYALAHSRVASWWCPQSHHAWVDSHERSRGGGVKHQNINLFFTFTASPFLVLLSIHTTEQTPKHEKSKRVTVGHRRGSPREGGKTSKDEPVFHFSCLSCPLVLFSSRERKRHYY